MNKFNVGDKVRIINYGNRIWEHDMAKDANPTMVGKVGVITQVKPFLTHTGKRVYTYAFKDYTGLYEDQLELIPQAAKVVTRNSAFRGLLHVYGIGCAFFSILAVALVLPYVLALGLSSNSWLGLYPFTILGLCGFFSWLSECVREDKTAAP